jgi:hypothetical protein
MIEYEVNLEIDTAIYDEFKIWLADHIKELLSFNGFKKAHLYEEASISSNKKNDKDRYKITIRYELDTLASLQDYFDNHASLMRKKTEEKFSGKFEASRRILTLDKVFS